ncbi:MAG: cupin domain-containing protein [Rhodospirillales bacterium]
MNDADDLDLQAGEYVLGTLSGEERARFAQRMAANPALRKMVQAWERRLGPMAERLPPVEPASGSFATIERRLDAEQDANSRTIRADVGEWLEVAPGVTMKRLHQDNDDAVKSVLLRLLPGASLPPHDHPHSEECLVIEGEITIGDLHLGAGDFHVAYPGSPHDAIRSRRGALLYVRGVLAA